MKKSLLIVAMAAAFGSTSALAVTVEGGSSDYTNVTPGLSNFSLFTTGYSGLSLSGSDRIDLYYGPIKGANTAIADTSAAATDAFGNRYLLGGHINWLAGILLGSTKIAQVWSTPASNGSAKFVMTTVRQMIDPPLPIMPAFGGLVIGQVANSSGVPLTQGNGVYFGEWAPKAANADQINNARLNMTDDKRTVWYVGDNAVTSTPNLTNVQYNVIGINQTGTDASGTTLAGGLPTSPNLYTGTLTANYTVATGTGSLTGSMTRGSSTLGFAGTTIHNDGRFTRGTDIEGRFYNGAQEIAGIHKAGTGVADDVAFGGSKVGGVITP